MSGHQIAINSAALRNLAARLGHLGYTGDSYTEAERIARERRKTADREAYRAKVMDEVTWKTPDALNAEHIPFRLRRKIEETSDGCWIWRGSLNSQGYGRTTRQTDAGRVRVGVHRYIYELLVGPIPQGLEPDHLCRVRACCNPNHLEPVTHRDNVLRGDTWAATNAAKTHCVRGHELTGDNLVLVRLGRQCRACMQIWGAERLARKTDEERARDAARARATRARKAAERKAAA